MNGPIAYLPLAASFLGMLSIVGGFLAYYTSSVRKRYAAERDFEHLKRNQEQIVQLLVQLDDSFDNLRAEVIRGQSPK